MSNEKQNAQTGVAVAPNKQANVSTPAPRIIGTYFHVGTNGDADLSRPRALCGDRVPVEVVLNQKGIDGTVKCDLSSTRGGKLASLEAGIGGREVIVLDFVTRKQGPGGWDAEDDVRGDVSLEHMGRVVSTQRTLGNLKITRPANARSVACIKRGWRATPRWTRVGGKWVMTSHYGYFWPCNFDLEFQDGEVIVTGRVRLESRLGAKITDDHKVAWKKQIEDAWNGRSLGARKIFAHRRGCARGRDCDCKVEANGCCAFPVRVVCNFVEKDWLTTVYVFPGEAKGPWGGDSWWYSDRWWIEEGRLPNSRAHEFGHNIGLYDEYPAGAIRPGLDPNTEMFDQSGIMNQGRQAMIGNYQEWLEEHGRLTGDPCDAVFDGRSTSA